METQVLTELQIVEQAKQCEQLGLFPFVEGVVKVGKESWVDKKIFTPQQKLFVYYYLGGSKETLFNGNKSALAAGYREQTANQNWQIKRLPQVDRAIKEGLAKMGLGKEEIKAMFAERAKVTFADLPYKIHTRKVLINGEEKVLEDAELDIVEAIRTGAIRFIKKINYSSSGRIGFEIVDAEDAQDKIARIHKLYGDEAGDGNGKNNTTPLSALAALVNENNELKKKQLPKRGLRKKKK